MIKVTGPWVKGLGTAKQFLQHPKYAQKFKEKLGFVPFPGTLNLQVTEEKMQEIEATAENLYIAGFEENGKEFGGINCFPCKINGLKAAIVIPDKTRHPENIMEIIAPENLVKRFNVQEGDTLRVEVE